MRTYNRTRTQTRTREDGAVIAKMKPISDLDLIKAIGVRRDSQAFKTLFERHHLKAYNLVFRITRRAELAEEAVQNGMLKIWLNCGTFDENKSKGAPSSWLYGIFAKEGLQALKSLRSQKKKIDNFQSAVPAPERDDPKNEDCEDISLVREAINGLTAQQQCMISLYYGAGLQQKDISRELGMPERTVSTKLKDALSQMRSSLTKAGLATAPTLAAEFLQKALLGGASAPTGLWKGIEQRLAENSLPVADATTPFPSRISAPQIAIAGLLLAVAITSAITLHNATPPDSIDANTDNTIPNLGVTSDSQEIDRLPLRKTWKFKSRKELQDFRTLKGRVRFVPKGQFESGALRTREEPTILEINFKNFKLPLQITAKYRGYNADKKQIGYMVTWNHTQGLFAGVVLEDFLVTGPTTLSTSKCYITEKCIDTWRGKIRQGMSHMPYTPGTGQFLTLSVFNCDLEYLDIREVKASEIPDPSYMATLIKRIPKNSRSGKVTIPEIKAKSTSTHKEALGILWYRRNPEH